MKTGLLACNAQATIFNCELIKYSVMSELVIIGNGFDLHHGLQTSYSAFENFAKQHSHSIYTLLSELFLASHEYAGLIDRPNAADEGSFIHERWCDFENCLGLIDDEEFGQRSREDISEYMEELGMEEALVGEFIENISGIIDVFRKWVTQIDLPLAKRHAFNFDPSTIFVNFNYTETLETFYEIDSARIFYIHGRRATKDQLIVGHDSSPPQPQSKDDLPDIHYNPFYAYLRRTRKPVEAITPKLENWLKTSSYIEQISVRGHSLGYVDLPYFKFLAAAYPDARWSFSYYNESGLGDIQRFINLLGLNKERISAVAKLSEFECCPNTKTNALPLLSNKLLDR